MKRYPALPTLPALFGMTLLLWYSQPLVTAEQTHTVGKMTALEFVKVLYLEGNGKKALTYLHNEAKGKSINNLKQSLQSGDIPPMKLKRVSLFSLGEMPALLKGFKSEFGTADAASIKRVFERTEKQMAGNLGCLVVFFTKQEGSLPLVNVFVFKESKGQYKVIYQDDN